MLAIQGGIDRVEANVETARKSNADALAEIKQMLSIALG